MMQPECD